MLLDAPRLVQVEVAKPELRKGERHGSVPVSALELDEGRVLLVRLPPCGQQLDTPGDNEVDDTHDVSEVERKNLTAPPDVLQPASDKPARELLDPDVRDVVPE